MLVVCAADQGWPEHATKLAQVLFRFLDTDAQFADAIVVYSSVGRAARSIGDHAVTPPLPPT